jgi:hypothetical protein
MSNIPTVPEAGTDLSPDQVLTVPAGDLANYPAEALFRLKNDAADLLGIAKGIVDHVDRALGLKYADRAQTLRLAAGKDTGVIHFDDGAVRVTANLPKKVEWDQARLALLAEQIAAAGDNPAEFLEVSYRVSETRFNAWPETIRAAFVPARTVKTGKPAFRLALIEE